MLARETESISNGRNAWLLCDFRRKREVESDDRNFGFDGFLQLPFANDACDAVRDSA